VCPLFYFIINNFVRVEMRPENKAGKAIIALLLERDLNQCISNLCIGTIGFLRLNV